MVNGILRAIGLFTGLAFSACAQAQVTMSWSPTTFKDSDKVSIKYSFKPSQQYKNASVMLVITSRASGATVNQYVGGETIIKNFPASVTTSVDFQPIDALGSKAGTNDRLIATVIFYPEEPSEYPENGVPPVTEGTATRSITKSCTARRPQHPEDVIVCAWRPIDRRLDRLVPKIDRHLDEPAKKP